MKLVSAGSLKPSTYNPRTADPRRLDMIELSLRKLGFVLPIFATPDGEISSGHQRHHVATRMGATQLPVSYTKPMELSERKAVNIAFNRGTNDLSSSDTPKNITEALSRISLDALAAAVPDKTPDTEDFYPCLRSQNVPLAPLLKANGGRWIQYATSISKTLYGKGVVMPIVATRDYRVVNGLGRLQMLAEKKAKAAQVVWVTDEEAALADAMLNLLSMDFNIHGRYEDLLRYNSFRRIRRTRSELGRGFTFAVIGNRPSRELDIRKPEELSKWVRVHGRSVLDFGAGHLHETCMLRNAGIRVTPFEPFHIDAHEDIDKKASLALTDEFLRDVAGGVRYTSCFISSVLNSVPFAKDREHIVCIVSAVCSPATKLFAVASGTDQIGWRAARGAEALNDKKVIAFKLEYEPGIAVGDITEHPKVQKYHTQEEFYRLFKGFFDAVQVSAASSNVQAICASPKKVDPQRLTSALEFEFDLPYPDGSRMNRVAEAKAAFSKRLRIEL